MNKKYLYILTAAIIIAAAAVITSGIIAASNLKKIQDSAEKANTGFTDIKFTDVKIMAESGPIIITADIADTNEKRELGLMFTKSLAENRGMLFIYNEPGLQYYWMMNTSIPLDIILIDENNRIVHVYENIEPCEIQQQCKIYPSIHYILYALEVNSGFVKNQGIRINDEVIIGADAGAVQNE